jgi:hypothetical protein
MSVLAVPTIGSKVRVQTQYSDNKIFTSQGIVVPSIFKDPTTFAVQTGNPRHPVSEITLKYVKSIDVLSGSMKALASEFKAWKVKSKDKVYLVTRTKARYECNCIGFQYNKKCKHITAVSNRS